MILKSHAKKYDIRHKTKARSGTANSLVRVSVMTGRKAARKSWSMEDKYRISGPSVINYPRKRKSHSPLTVLCAKHDVKHSAERTLSNNSAKGVPHARTAGRTCGDFLTWPIAARGPQR
ncbi:uncharacterized protein LOC127011562 [Drosophila biarmipes]|uniref:uncharacterized protein LOC127011562 n=1 Tax=Drosophila biarmipes TaxID=125945 RepID=UPI0021CCDF3C|nr:uncharacterized protein LOC127011562 [Drosophila biarmipes]